MLSGVLAANTDASYNRGRVRYEVIRFMITWEWVILRCYKLHSPFSSSFTISLFTGKRKNQLASTEDGAV